MKINCKREDFLEAIQVVQNALTSTALPVLSYVLLEARPEKITLTATNLETTIRSSFPAQVEGEGEICLPGDKVFYILRELPSAPVTLEIEKSKATIRCKKAMFQLLGLSPEDFPEVPQTMVEKFFSLSQEKLRQMIQRTAFAASRDETHQNLNGSYLEIEGKEAKLVATDGRRLSFVHISLDSSDISSGEAIIPLRALQQLLRILNGDKEVKVGISERQIFFQMDHILFISQLIDAKFPDYRKVIPTEFTIAVLVDRDDLLRSVRRVSLLTDEKSRLLKFQFKENTLLISAEAPELGYAHEEIDVRRERGGEIEIGFSSTYLLDILKNIEKGEVRIELTDSEGPGVIRPSESKDHICVLMPVRLGGVEEEEVEVDSS